MWGAGGGWLAALNVASAVAACAAGVRMFHAVVTLCNLLSPEKAPIRLGGISLPLSVAGMLLNLTVVPVAAAYTAVQPAITWAGITYVRRGGLIAKVVHPARAEEEEAAEEAARAQAQAQGAESEGESEGEAELPSLVEVDEAGGAAAAGAAEAEDREEGVWEGAEWALAQAEEELRGEGAGGACAAVGTGMGRGRVGKVASCTGGRHCSGGVGKAGLLAAGGLRGSASAGDAAVVADAWRGDCCSHKKVVGRSWQEVETSLEGEHSCRHSSAGSSVLLGVEQLSTSLAVHVESLRRRLPIIRSLSPPRS
eukprot:TRINITY_DN7187_c0_g5_i1.p1 TRINITY_DN7187_c0_g5~~TRINITY_DN7187_c0_g5_i1.p1  ORF type:complete len:342 (-),score=16.36 TRINITY_DN7187_c0_g5_i1:207-1136(-)